VLTWAIYVRRPFAANARIDDQIALDAAAPVDLAYI
jgi:hypothetical protein